MASEPVLQLEREFESGRIASNTAATAAQDFSPRREPWVIRGNRFSPEGAKEYHVGLVRHFNRRREEEH